MLVIFDLDGTLIDSRLDLALSVNAARASLGRPALPHDLIFKYVGNGAPTLMKRAMGPDVAVEEVAQSLAFFLDYYRAHALDNTVLYEGVLESLERLRSAGIQLAVLTNKPVAISLEIVEALKLGPLLFRTYGGDSFPRKKPDPTGIETLRREANAEAEDTWMVGDSAVDIQTARNAGVSACGVTYGFQPETLEDNPPDLLVGHIADFAAAIIGRS